jgi:hypothetical protein
MAEIPDLYLHRPQAPGDSTPDGFTDPSARTKWVIIGLLFLIAAATIGYVGFRRRSPTVPVTSVRTPAAVDAPARRRGGPLVEADRIPLPPLSEMDAVVRELVVKLSSHPAALAWLSTKGLIDNFTVATLNVSEGKTPVQHWPALRPKERFAVTKTPRGMRLDPRSYRRYDQFAAAIGGLDPAGTARLYLTLKPRITESYRNLGFPEGDFDGVLERAIATLLTSPSIAADVELRPKVLSYVFVDADIEALPSAQKQLLRMGPDNMRIVLTKLREIAVQLGLHPESVPQ